MAACYVPCKTTRFLNKSCWDAFVRGNGFPFDKRFDHLICPRRLRCPFGIQLFNVDHFRVQSCPIVIIFLFNLRIFNEFSPRVERKIFRLALVIVLEVLSNHIFFVSPTTQHAIDLCPHWIHRAPWSEMKSAQSVNNKVIKIKSLAQPRWQKIHVDH